MAATFRMHEHALIEASNEATHKAEELRAAQADGSRGIYMRTVNQVLDTLGSVGIDLDRAFEGALAPDIIKRYGKGDAEGSALSAGLAGVDVDAGAAAILAPRVGRVLGDAALRAVGADDTAAPVGVVFHFLIRAENRCPLGQGPLGTSSSGVPEPSVAVWA